MKKERWIIGIIVCVVVLALCIGLWNLVLELWTDFTTAAAPTTAPSRMATQIDIRLHPEDPRLDRTYSSQENLTYMLHLLRDMHTDDLPEETPSLTDGQSYYSIAVTYANGSTAVYHVLGHRYMQLLDASWCAVDSDLVLEFTDFIRSHPNDNGVSPPPVVTEATDPTETTVPETTGESDT